MLSVRTDTFPLIVTTFGEGLDFDDFSVFREVHEEILGRCQAYVSLIDTSNLVTVPPISLREEIVAFTQRNADGLATQCLATEVVVKSIAVRAALTTVQWFTSTPSQVSLHASLRPAVSRALDVVWTHQLPTSTELMAYHDDVMRSQSIPPQRNSGSFTKRAINSSIEGLLRRARRSDEK